MAAMAFTRSRFGRNDVVFPDPVPEHPLLAGRAELGRGEYSIVLEGPAPGHVLKVLSSPGDHFFLTADDRPQGTHFPRVFADHGVVGRAASGYLMHLVEVERLEPIAAGTPASEQADVLTNAYWRGCQDYARLGPEMGRIALYHLVERPPPALAPSLVEALGALSNFIETYQVRPDILSDGNLMARSDGTLVFSDPVFLG